MRENNILFQKEFVFSNLPNRRFDFGILNNNNELLYLIEFDGKQHFKFAHTWHQTQEEFELAQKRDQEKNEFCITNRIPLIRIPYYDINKITISELIPETSNYLIN